MVGILEIRSHTVTFRTAIEQCSEQLRAISLKDFPRGSCGDVSDMLGMYLREQLGIDCKYLSGQAGQQSHAWLEFEGIKIDMTADQFPGTDSVIVSTESDFHRQFTARSRSQPGIGGAVGWHGSDLVHDYRLIAAKAIEVATKTNELLRR
mgnify:CR=1 FL=1